MTVFNEGDQIRVRSNGAEGVIVYAESGYYCVELNTGAEQDFEDAGLLILEDEYQADRERRRLEAEAQIPSSSLADNFLANIKAAPYVPRKGDSKLAAKVIGLIQSIYPLLLEGMTVKVDGFDKLKSFDKVKALSEATDTPMVVFMGAAEMGGDDFMRQVISKTMLNNLLNDSSLAGDMLLGHARKVIDEHKGDK